MLEVNGWWIPDGDAGRPDAQLNDEAGRALARQQIERALRYVRGRYVAIQGGARCGLWPLELASRFVSVLAFEADPENYACAARNLAGTSNAVVVHRALGQSSGVAALHRSAESNGMHFVTEQPDLGATVPVGMLCIDELHVAKLDALFLDVEGYELEVCKGARRTLERCRPVIVAEENLLIERYGRTRGELMVWLSRLGYRCETEVYTLPDEVQHDGGFHGSDLIFVPNDAA